MNVWNNPLLESQSVERIPPPKLLIRQNSYKRRIK